MTDKKSETKPGGDAYYRPDDAAASGCGVVGIGFLFLAGLAVVGLFFAIVFAPMGGPQ